MARFSHRSALVRIWNGMASLGGTPHDQGGIALAPLLDNLKKKFADGAYPTSGRGCHKRSLRQ